MSFYKYTTEYPEMILPGKLLTMSVKWHALMNYQYFSALL